MGVKDYDLNPDNNTQINGINIAEGCPPSGINNAIRQMMADVKADSDAQNEALTTFSETPASAEKLGPVMPQTGNDDGLELETDGKLRVRKATATQYGGVLASVTALANAVPLGGTDGSLNADWLKKAMDAAAAAQQAADAAQETADQAISAAGGAGNVSLISQRSTAGEWSITGLDVGKPLYITASSSSQSGYVFFSILSGSLDGTVTSNKSHFQFGRYDAGNWVSLTPPGSVIIPNSTRVIVAVENISGITLRAYQ